MVEGRRPRSVSVAEPTFAENPAITMPGRTLPNDDKAEQVSRMIDEDLRVSKIILRILLMTRNAADSGCRKNT